MYVIFYQKNGSRINGSYLVNAPSKSTARNVFHLEYDGMNGATICGGAMTVEEYCEEFDQTVEELYEEVGGIPEEGRMVLIEAGT
jgi:hypothetical protein